MKTMNAKTLKKENKGMNKYNIEYIPKDGRIIKDQREFTSSDALRAFIIKTSQEGIFLGNEDDGLFHIPPSYIIRTQIKKVVENIDNGDNGDGPEKVLNLLSNKPPKKRGK